MKSQGRILRAVFAIFLLSSAAQSAQAQEKTLHGHVPPAAALTQPIGQLPETNVLRLAISLPLRNGQELTNLLRQIYDPASPNYHHYLTPAEFNARFGPTAEDYQKVVQFAKSSGFQIVGTYDSRKVLDVQGTVGDIEKAFHVTLRTYRHLTENRQFHAPDVDPTVDSSLPILDVEGLSDYALPRPAVHVNKNHQSRNIPASGSQSPNGNYMGSDFRHAYAPGVSLNGAGQWVGLLEFDGFYTNDILSYESLIGYTNVTVQTNHIDGYNGSIGSDNVEVALDIEMVIAMAPGVKAVEVFTAPGTSGTAGWLDILEAMVSSNQIKQFSSSWGYTGSPDPNTSDDSEFMQMAMQGQSFFQASGDGDAWINPVWVPGDSPYVISVGGTTLTMNGAGVSYNSETVWNWGNQGSGNGWSANETVPGQHHAQNDYVGSGGGISPVYTIPYWQTNAISSTNQGSATMRNVPDVALTADQIWIYFDDGSATNVGGTSCAAPLWAGFTALINQQAALSGQTNVGFINPAIYAIGRSPAYASAFHDVAAGNDTNLYSTNRWSATMGYDLCTGWGTPNGMGLINALLLPEPLIITPASGFAATGPYGGPFSPTNQNFVLTNSGATSLNWSLTNLPPWLTASSTNGTLAAAGPSVTVNVGLNAAANSLVAGAYTSTVFFYDSGTSNSQPRLFSLTVTKAAPVVTWATPSSIVYGTALGAGQLDAAANVPGAFVYNPASGTVLTAGSHSLSVVFTPSDTTDYTSATNTVNLTVTPAPLSVTANNASRVYGTTNPAFTDTIVGVTNGDNITASNSCSALTNSPVGTYSIVPSLVDPNDRQTNYTVTLTNGTLTITMATPSLSWSNPAPIVYGTALGPGQLDATANTSGNFVYSPPTGTVFTVGSHTLSVVFTPSNTNYTGATNTVNLTVTPAPLSVTASNASRVYGTTNPIFTDIIVGVTNGDNITASNSCSALTNSPVGMYSIVPSLVDPNDRQTNYTVTLTNGTLTITMATPSLSWSNPAPIVYGTALDTNQLNATASIPGNFAYTPPPDTVLDTGTNSLDVLFTPNDTTNYATAGASVSLVVTPAPLSVTASNASRVYGTTNPIFTDIIVGVTNGDNITASNSCSALTNSPVGTYSIVPSLVDPNDAETNYIVTLTNGTLTITMATPSLSWSAPAPINYPVALDTNQLNATASVPGDFVYTPPGGTVPPPGTNTLDVLFTPNDTTNYTTAGASANLDVSLVSIPLNIQFMCSNVILTWDDPDFVFSLQTAPSVICVFTNVPGATNPYTNTYTNTQQFFRLMAP